RIPVGLGWAGFSVAGRRAVTQEQRGDDEYVTCYDVATGKLLWGHKDAVRFSEGMGGDGPRATPTIDVEKKLVYSLGATGILNCLDLATGQKKWGRNILTDTGTKNLMWAKSSAPLLYGPHVIVSGGDTAPTLIALRRDTGDIAWKAGSDGASYSSPVVLTLAGREQIVSVNKFSVTGHDPATGEVLWTFDWPSDNAKVSQPVPAGDDQILVSSSYGMKSHLLKVAKDAGGKFACTVVWTNTAPRTKFSSPAIIGKHAYGLDEGTLACVNLADGERTWREGRYGFGQHLIVGDHLLIQTEQGDVVLVKANPERLEEVGRLDALSSKTWNPPTLAGRWLLVRNDREAICYEIPGR
ncbi:MAG: PQQ-binding-like beta-propeller repeat protein, partial [Roseimicrobium sp.]